MKKGFQKGFQTCLWGLITLGVLGSGVAGAEIPELQLRRQEVEMFLQRTGDGLASLEAIPTIGDVSVHVMSIGAILVSGFQFFDECLLKGHSSVGELETFSGGKILAKVTQVPAGVGGAEVCPEKIWVLMDQALFRQWKTFYDKAKSVLASPLSQGEIRKAKEKVTTLFKSYWVQQISLATQQDTSAYGVLCELEQGTQVVELSREVYLVVSRSKKKEVLPKELSPDADGFEKLSRQITTTICPVGTYVLNLRPERLF